MTKPLGAALLASVVVAAGCVGSIFPLWSGPEMVFDARLVGTWHQPGAKGWIDVRASGPFTYRVMVRDDSGKTGTFAGMLGRLDGRLVLDLQPDVTHLDAPQQFIGMLQPLHAFLIVDSLGERPQLSLLDPDSLKAYLATHPGAVRADTLTAGVVLEAGPRELQAFLRGYLQRPGVAEAQTPGLTRCHDCQVPPR
ncbi:MAG TPA: hypothetical protein VEH83_00775 [Gemmatimonadales bacterium]|nr:hypothetical protein [Gemmatimonadales bacterium]